MPIARGSVVSLLFAIAWLGLVFHSRPRVDHVPPDRAAIHAAVVSLETWSFTPALLMEPEWGSVESPSQLAIYDAHPAEWLSEASALLASIDEKIGRRLVGGTVLTILGVLAFWGGVLVFARAKAASQNLGARAWVRGLLAGGILLVGGPLAPCLVTEGGRSGLLLSGPPIVTGLVIAAFSLISRPRQPPPTTAR